MNEPTYTLERAPMMPITPDGYGHVLSGAIMRQQDATAELMRDWLCNELALVWLN